MKRPRRSGLVAFLLPLLVGCGGDAGTTVRLDSLGPGASNALVRATDRDGDPVFVLRVDGSVGEVIDGRFTADESQYLVVTGPSGGSDQCKLLVLSANGTVVTEYRVRGESPWPAGLHDSDPGARFRQRQYVEPGSVLSFVHGGRRWLAFYTRGIWSPSSLVVLEATARDRLEPRIEFWNRGHIHRIARAGPLVAFFALNNLEASEDVKYGFAVGVHRVGAGGGGDVTGVSPNAGLEGVGVGPGFVAYATFPRDRAVPASPVSLDIEGRSVRVTMDSGLDFVISLDQGEARLVATEFYRRTYADLRARDDSLPPVDAHLDALRDRVHSWSSE